MVGVASKNSQYLLAAGDEIESVVIGVESNQSAGEHSFQNLPANRKRAKRLWSWEWRMQ